MAFAPLFDSLYVRVWCEPSNLSNLNERNSTALEFFVSCDPNADNAFIRTISGGKITAFKVVVRLSEAKQAMLRKSFYPMDTISTFYQSAYRVYPNTGNFAYTSAVSQNNNQFCFCESTTRHFNFSFCSSRHDSW